jgi:hypothetical protein
MPIRPNITERNDKKHKQSGHDKNDTDILQKSRATVILHDPPVQKIALEPIILAHKKEILLIQPL